MRYVLQASGIKCVAILSAALLSWRAQAGGWTFSNAAHAPDKASGRDDGATLAISMPSKRSCAWWEKEFRVTPGRGVRFRAKAKISLAPAETALFNDLMMFTTWYDPAKGAKKGVPFIQRDFMRYSDSGNERIFDDVFAVPGKCDTVRVEFIAKWHAMDVEITEISVEETDPPKPRRVRCVVGNPWEKPAAAGVKADWRKDGTSCAKRGWDDPVAVRTRRLAQIETTLTNIFAHVENPDIILFAETFVDTGSPRLDLTAENIPGGPSFALASKYASSHRCNIAMNIHEKTDEGTFHNSTFIVDRAGRLAGIYRKTTLTSGEYMAGMLPGNDFGVFDLDFGRVGCLTCWDNWFSESAKFLRRKGAEILLFPLAGCESDHIETTFPSRAIDTGIPSLVAIRQKHLPSGIIDRNGIWVAKTFEENGFAVADIDLNDRKRVFWLSVGPGMGDPYQLYIDESRPELYEKQNLRLPRR